MADIDLITQLTVGYTYQNRLAICKLQHIVSITAAT